MRGLTKWLLTLCGTALILGMSGGLAHANDPNEHMVAKAQVYAMDTWPEEFAGLWLDFDYQHKVDPLDREGIPEDQKVLIAFTEGAEEKVAELRTRFPAVNPFVAVTHEWSLKTLQSLQREVNRDLRAYKAGELAIPGPTFDWHMTAIWVVDNELEVNLSVVTPEYQAWAADRYGSMYTALKIFVGGKVVPTAGRLKPLPQGNCNAACHKAMFDKKARKKAQKKALRKKCRKAARKANRTGSKKAKRLVRSKKCRAVLR